MDKGIRVLHVDDDPEICDLTASYLERTDDRLSVVTESSARDGLDVLDSERIDCVVSDYQMPEIDGFGFLEMVRERDPDLPFILYTGKGPEEIASEALAAGVTDYLQKKSGDTQFELLANRIANAVDRYRATHRPIQMEGGPGRLLDGVLGMYAITRCEGADSVITECNDEFAEGLGYDTDELVGTALSALLAEDSQSVPQSDGESSDDDWPARTFETASGDPVELRVRDSPWTDGDDGSEQTLFAFVDDSRRAELAEKAEFYETILNTVPDAVYALDEDMHYLFVNEGMAELTGYPQEDIIGSHKSMVNTDESVKSGQAKRMDLAEDHRDGVKIAIHPHVTADGEEIPTEVRFSMLPAPEDDFRGTAGVVRDVTDRLERQRELERQNRRLDEFASVVSHDLRNPINIAQGRVDLVRSDCDDEFEAHLTKASEALERMNALIDDVLSFARQGEAVTEFEPADLGTLARDAWEAVGDQQGTLVVENDATISGKTVRLQRLFENLLRNAREHAGESVTVRVGTLPDGFYVEDDGPGIPPDEREDVFDPGVTTAEGGTGFGLAIVKSIVESHGWTVDVTDAETGGARFEISGLDQS